MGDPKSREEFYVKGLVVGSVQAGKTQNFNAVINRAIDSGYGLIIVLAFGTENTLCCYSFMCWQQHILCYSQCHMIS